MRQFNSYRNKRKPEDVVEAVQWYRFGDHPHDGLAPGPIVTEYKHPIEKQFQDHDVCGFMWQVHGWIDQAKPERVCPGNFIITIPDTLAQTRRRFGNYYSMTPGDFAESYTHIAATPKPKPHKQQEKK